MCYLVQFLPPNSFDFRNNWQYFKTSTPKKDHMMTKNTLITSHAAWTHLFAGNFLIGPVHALSSSILIISSTLFINLACSPGTMDKSLTFPLRYSIKMNPAQYSKKLLVRRFISYNNHWESNSKSINWPGVWTTKILFQLNDLTELIQL